MYMYIYNNAHDLDLPIGAPDLSAGKNPSTCSYQSHPAANIVDGKNLKHGSQVGTYMHTCTLYIYVLVHHILHNNQQNKQKFRCVGIIVYQLIVKMISLLDLFTLELGHNRYCWHWLIEALSEKLNT